MVISEDFSKIEAIKKSLKAKYKTCETLEKFKFLKMGIHC
jgi:hypothetical protein